ncbi:MAG TPA: SpoIIE family protein phosphatase [Bryobacteraceae bacterium]|nr:SpoIIE family protein phosphatase [Bryobacteraceae bacterium]
MNASEGAFGRQANLLVINPSGNRQRMALSSLPFTIGRQAESNLVLRDNRASRNHARIFAEAADFFIEDLNSRHGVLVNGSRIAGRQKLSSGDKIEFGVQDSYKIVFTLEEAEIQRLMEQLGSPLTRTGAPANLAKLRALVEVARTVQSSLSTHSVLSAVVDAALTVTSAQRGFLLLRDGEELHVTVARDYRGAAIPTTELQVPTKLIHKALSARRELLSMNFDPRVQFLGDPDISTANLPLRSVVCVPLVHVRTGGSVSEETQVVSSKNETVGVLYLESRLGATDLSAGDRELLQTLAIEASTILENARLLEQERLRQKMDEELKIAREIQQSLMPRKLPQSGWFRAAAASIPSHQVGGDYCDVRQLEADLWAFVVADVSGKGVSSALLASLLQGAFLAGGHAAMRIDVLMAHVNQFLTERTEGEKYATLFCGVLSKDGHMRWSNAGHCPPLVIKRSGEVVKLSPTSMPLGLLAEAEFSVDHTQIEAGDKIVVYTDGVSEAQNRAGQFFESKRLELLMRANPSKSCEELIAILINAVETFTEDVPQSDDITAVVMEYAPVGFP